MVEIINTIEGLETIKPIWERLETNPLMRVFQSYAWNHSAWQVALSKDPMNKLWIAKWSSGEDVVILPTFIDGSGTLRIMLDRGVDVGNAVYAPGFNHHIAYQEIAKAVMEEKRIRRVHLQKLSGDGEALNYLSTLLRPSISYKDNAYSWLDVVPSDDFVAAQKHMRSKDRADLKNLRKKAQKYTLKILSRHSGDDFPEQEMCLLLAVMSKGTRRKEEFLSSVDVAFAKSLYEAGKCEVAILEEDGDLQALNLILLSGGRKLSWEFLYADPKAGTALYLLYFERRCPAPYLFDFGVGVYSYKIGTFRPKIAATYSLCFAKSKIEMLKAMVGMNLRVLKDYIKSLKK